MKYLEILIYTYYISKNLKNCQIMFTLYKGFGCSLGVSTDSVPFRSDGGSELPQVRPLPEEVAQVALL